MQFNKEERNDKELNDFKDQIGPGDKFIFENIIFEVTKIVSNYVYIYFFLNTNENNPTRGPFLLLLFIKETLETGSREDSSTKTTFYWRFQRLSLHPTLAWISSGTMLKKFM